MQRAQKMTRGLAVVGFGLCLVVVLGLIYHLHPAIIAIAALLDGWVLAERNALQYRIAQWPHLSRYIDWSRVEEDIRHDHTTPY